MPLTDKDKKQLKYIEGEDRVTCVTQQKQKNKKRDIE